MRDFSVGAGIIYFKPTVTMLRQCAQHPDWLKPEVRFGSVFDTFPSAIWNGGRLCPGRRFSRKTMRAVVRFYNGLGIGVRYTFSNSLLEKRHLGDRYCNAALEAAHDPRNGVIVNSPVLEEYVRRRYPDFQIIGSASADDRDPAALRRRQREVDLLVLPPDCNYDLKLLASLDPARVEIIANERCQPGCPLRVSHYLDVSRRQLASRQTADGCRLPRRPRKTMAMTNDRLDFLHHKFGFTHFKLANRYSGGPEFAVQMVGYYLIREEFRIPFLKACGARFRNYKELPS